MPRAQKMTDKEIEKALENLPFWQVNQSKIVREITAENFPAIIGIVNAIALIAEKMDHHPDMLLYGWNKLRIELSTHDQNGLTRLDFEQAKQIDELKLDYFK